jgi:hypothetical protein
MLSGLGKARRTGGMLSEGLAEAYRLALRREDILAGRTPADYALDVALADRFLSDEQETAQEIQILRAAQVLSVERAVEMQAITGQEAVDEVALIKEEFAPAAPAGMEAGRFAGGATAGVSG